MTGFAPTVPLASHVTRHVAGGKKTVKAQFHVPKSGSGDDVRVLAAPVSVPYCAPMSTTHHPSAAPTVALGAT